MSQLINIYADESCHLESKNITSENRFMVLGGISCPDDKKQLVFQELKKIKSDNGLRHFSEMKWVKISRAKISAYREVIRYFFESDALNFRAVIIDKQQLKHSSFNHTHDEFYYKMYWKMLEWFIDQRNYYHIYLDIKDTQGHLKVRQLHKVLCNSHHDFNRKVIENIQEVRSHEIVVMQIVDLLIGAISYANRYPQGGKSIAKQEVIELVKSLSKRPLVCSTSLSDGKFNLLHWEGQKR